MSTTEHPREISLIGTRTDGFPGSEKFFLWGAIIALAILLLCMWQDKNQQMAKLEAQLAFEKNTLHLTNFVDAAMQGHRDDRYIFTVVDDIDVSLPGVERVIILQSAGINGNRGALYVVPSYSFPGNQFIYTKAPKGTKCYPDVDVAARINYNACFTPEELASAW